MISITSADIYSYPGSAIASIQCGCGAKLSRKVQSIRVNVERNGVFKCHACVISDPSYRSKQAKFHRTRRTTADDMVTLTCSCGHTWKIKSKNWKVKEKHGRPILCGSCATKASAHKRAKTFTADFLDKLKASGKKFWDANRAEWRSFMQKYTDDPAYIAKMSKCGKKAWEDLEYASRMRNIASTPRWRKAFDAAMGVLWDDVEFRARIKQAASEGLKNKLLDPGYLGSRAALYADPAFIEKLKANGRKAWKDPSFRERMAVHRASQPKISSLQQQLYQYLNDFSIEFYEECEKTRIGHYVFDCLVPKRGNMAKHLLIECQGDYWHSLPGVPSRDKGKFTYIDRYFPDYEIMYVWEHEFGAQGRVIDRLKAKLGFKLDVNDFQLKDVMVKECPSKTVRSFLNSYHYIGKDRGGKCFGAFLGDELIGCIVYGQPLRQNMADKYGSFVELSRLCIHPLRHKKNFASWFVSKTVKKAGADKIVAYADRTVGHLGTTYKAAGFKFSHEVTPDYWYVDGEGYVMHKRTLYGKAVKMRITEKEFAEKNGYVKVYGGGKLCFIREL